MAKTNTLNGRPWNRADKTAWLSSIPTHTYVIGLILVIGVLLLLSGDFGRSWDMSVHEYNGRKAYDLYFGGFDVQKFRENHDNMAYGPVLDVLIQLVQDLTTDPIEKFKIRVVLEALVSLSCLIPIFLISARVLPRPLALIAVALVLSTPSFFGHAFINPKNSPAMSGFLWSLWLILHCFERRRPNVWSLVGLGVLLGLTASIRFVTAYLLMLIPLVIAVSPQDRAASADGEVLRERPGFPYRELAIILVTFAVTYTLAMPAILTSFGAHAYGVVVRQFAHIGWKGEILYFGRQVSAQQLPWHYIYGYLLVQLPLYYHFFALTLVVAAVGWRRRTLQTFRAFWADHPEARSSLVLLLASLALPLALILLIRPVLYDGFRHVFFIVPLLCMLLYFGFVIVLGQMERTSRIVLVTLATACWIQSVVAMVRLHPYEYAYYNPLVNPAHSFELDYWGTSFREVAEQLNDYVRQNTPAGEKLSVWICGPVPPLELFLDPDRFKVVEDAATADFRVVLNRGTCPDFLKTPPLISVGRGDLVFATAGH